MLASRTQEGVQNSVAVSAALPCPDLPLLVSSTSKSYSASQWRNLPLAAPAACLLGAEMQHQLALASVLAQHS